MKILDVSLGLIVLIAHGIAVASTGSEHWRFVSNDLANYKIERSVDAQEGEKLILVDGSKLKDSVEFFKGYEWRYSSKPKAYIYQSIDAKPYISKHLHISGFARGVKPNLAEFEKQFSEGYEGAQQVRLTKFLDKVSEADQPKVIERFNKLSNGTYEQKLSQFRLFSQNSYENSEYGIGVILYMGETSKVRRNILIHGPTSSGAPRLNELWNRFNVEVSIPEDCQSISIVLWQKGITIAEFDHIVISDRGPAIETNRSNFGVEEILLREIVERKNLETVFSNLSFE